MEANNETEDKEELPFFKLVKVETEKLEIGSLGASNPKSLLL